MLLAMIAFIIALVIVSFLHVVIGEIESENLPFLGAGSCRAYSRTPLVLHL
jgi:hypothetical protein